jgi:hypothetical protein
MDARVPRGLFIHCYRRGIRSPFIRLGTPWETRSRYLAKINTKLAEPDPALASTTAHGPEQRVKLDAAAPRLA